VYRRYLTSIFNFAARKLDELVASSESIVLPTSFMAALVFYYICGNDFIENEDDFTISITGYDVASSNYVDLIQGEFFNVSFSDD
jgi:hypothetical protein